MLRSVVKLSYCHGFGTFIWFGAVEHPTPQSARTMLVVQHTDQKGSSQSHRACSSFEVATSRFTPVRKWDAGERQGHATPR